MMQHLLYKSLGSLTVVALASLITTVLPVTAPSAHAQDSDPNQGLPPGTRGGGSRGPMATCGVSGPLIAFMPDTHVLKVAEEQLNLWVYLPTEFSMAEAEFLLYDENETAIVDRTFSVVNQSGFLKIDLKAIAQNLEYHQNYRWFFSLVCPSSRAADVSVDGWLQLTPMSSTLASHLNSEDNPVEQANLYIAEGMWSDAVSTLLTWHETPEPVGVSSLWTTVIETLNPASDTLHLTTPYQLVSLP